MATYLCSDLHVGSDHIADMRGFADADAWDVEWTETWADTVTDSDTVWVLGDLANNAAGVRRACALLGTLPGRKRLIWGNHDPGSPLTSAPRPGVEGMLRGTFLTCEVMGRTYLSVDGHGKVGVLLSHMPYAGIYGRPESATSASELALAPFRLTDLGLPLVHGHAHGQVPCHLRPDTMNVTYESTGHLLTSGDEVAKWVEAYIDTLDHDDAEDVLAGQALGTTKRLGGDHDVHR